jgi:hypothetical protein
MSSFWDQGKVPQDFNDASIIHLYKRKGNRQACDNHCGIFPLSIAGVLLAWVLLNRLIKHLEDGLLPESQCGFRTWRIWCSLHVSCKKSVRNRTLTKAFDTVSTEGLGESW